MRASPLAALDGARASLLGLAARSPRFFRWVRSREARIVARAYVAIVVALAFALVVPTCALALGPLLLGVPHVAASARYLVLRQTRARGWTYALVLGCGGLVLARVLSLASAPGGAGALVAAKVEVVLGCALGAVAALFGASGTGSKVRAALAVGALAALAATLVAHPFAGRLVFVHVHNLGVVALWVALFRHRSAAHVVAALLLGLAIVVLVPPLSTAPSAGVAFEDVAAWLGPGLGARAAGALVLAHVYTDSIHYAFWLGVVPEQELRGEGSLTFRQTVRGLGRDFGRALPWIVVASVLVPLLALLGAEVARRLYFTLFGFHGYIEGAALVLAFVRGRAALGRGAPAPARGDVAFYPFPRNPE